MTAFEKMVLKSRLISYFEERGYRVCGTDTPQLTIFSSTRLNAKSKYWGNYGSSSYLTTFGPKEAMKLLES